MFLHYIKTAIRAFNKYKTQNIISIIGLAVSLLCFCLCMYCCRYMQSVDTCFPLHKRIAELQMYSEGELFSGTPATLVEKLQTNYSDIEALTRIVYIRERSYNVVVKEDKILPYTLSAMEVDTTYHQVFTPEVIAGNWKQAAQTPNSIIMAESTARKIFGQPNNAIGKQMILSRRLISSPESTPKTGGISYTIGVVVRDFPTNASMNLMQTVDILALNDSEGLLNSSFKNGMTGCDTYALLQKGKKPVDLEKQFRNTDLKINFYNEDMKISASPIGASNNKQQVLRIFSWITGVSSILILLTGMLNFFHFLIGTFLNRIHEYSIRKVTGGNSWQLFGLLSTQSSLLLIISFLLVFCFLEQFGSELKISMFRINLDFETKRMIWQTLEYFILSLLFGIFICTIITLRIRNISVQTGIRGGVRRLNKHHLRNFMLGLQLFICWLFVSFAAALYLQFNKTSTTLFDTLSIPEKESIFSISLDYSFMQNNEKLNIIERFRQHAGVKDILLSDVSYASEASGIGIQTEKDDKNSSIGANIMCIPSNFFTFMNIPLLSGHSIESNTEILVDQLFAERHPENSQTGTTLYNRTTGYTICGIASTFNSDVYNQSEGFVFLPADFSEYVGHCYIKCYPGQEKAVKQWIHKILIETLPASVTPRVKTFQDDIIEEQALESTLKGIVLFFSIVCICITLLGIYSAITLDTEYRKKEVAIRKINGAGIRAITLLFAWLYIRLLFFSALLALPLVALAFRVWKRFYTVFFNDGPLFWISIALTIILVVTGTIASRIFLISRLNPAEVIKSE
ncbi:ABC transporter permease [Parabacteroides sp. AM08-6]|uniref:ABC transporter permease n=1 Tax=Parabacteroides sp. AM08-6 TaxID=2292053 RepID=UPI000EFF2F9C|nr:ABC transporter permease [Parabacteroides sp. AM08-6]RHJ79588.1 ABC transporter permease [Parabacteroides sp. AM08-6]